MHMCFRKDPITFNPCFVESDGAVFYLINQFSITQSINKFKKINFSMDLLF